MPPLHYVHSACTTLQHAPGRRKGPFWLTYWLGCAHCSGKMTQTLCPSLSLRWILKNMQDTACQQPPKPNTGDTHYHCKRQPGSSVSPYAHCKNLVKTGSLHPTKVITRATSLVPLGGLPVAGLNRRPYFACRNAMQTHVKHLSSYCEFTLAPHTHTRTNAHRPYVYRHPRSVQEVEEACLQRALTGSLNTGLMPSSSLCAKGGAGAANFAGDLYPIMGAGKVTPYTVTRGRVPVPAATATCTPSNVSTCVPCPQATCVRHV